MLYRIAKLVLIPLAKVLYRPVVEGRGNVPMDGPVILASNHLSFIDSVVIPLLAPRKVVFLAKAEYFRGRGVSGLLTRWWFTAIGMVPVERGTHRAAQASLEAAVSVLEGGNAFGIYPEGTRSRDGRLYRGRTGVGWLVLQTGAPVVPVALIGTDKVQPIGTNWPRIGRRIIIRFGEPLELAQRYAEQSSARARRAITDDVMAAIHELSGQEQASVYNEAPHAA